MNIRELKKICQKNDDEIFITDKLIFRKLSIYVTKIFIIFNISANGATLLSLVCALIGSLLLMSNSSIKILIAFIFVFLYWVLDYVDGELARYNIFNGKQKPSLQGEYFDYLVHFFSTNIMFICIGYSSYVLYDNKLFYILGVISGIGISNFPNLVASMIIVKNINKKSKLNDEQKQVISELDDGQKGKETILNNNKINKFIQFMKEILLFPGCLNMIMIVSLLDGIFNNRSIILGYNFRTIYLIIFSMIMLLNTIRKSVFWIKKMKNIS